MGETIEAPPVKNALTIPFGPGGRGSQSSALAKEHTSRRRNKERKIVSS